MLFKRKGGSTSDEYKTVDHNLKRSEELDEGIDCSSHTQLTEASSFDDDCDRASLSLEGNTSYLPADASHSINECIHIPVHKDIKDLVKRRTSRSSDFSSSTDRSRVSFLDEELGLTTRFVVTEIRYRPRTTDEEKKELFYARHDFDMFEQEELYERIENVIQETEARGEIKAVVNDPKIKKLMCRMTNETSVRTVDKTK